MPIQEPSLLLRILICGTPQSGKTTLAKGLASELPNCAVIHGDDFMHLPWAEQKEALRDAVVATEGNLIVEGCNAVRVLRYDLGFNLVIEARTAQLKKEWLGMAKMTKNKLAEWGGDYCLYHMSQFMKVVAEVKAMRRKWEEESG